jgi:hypothetical protein
MEDTPDRGSPPRTEGRLIHWAFLYDLLLRVRARRGMRDGNARDRGQAARSPGLKHGREADGEDQAEVLGPIPGPHLHGDEVHACPLGE